MNIDCSSKIALSVSVNERTNGICLCVIIHSELGSVVFCIVITHILIKIKTMKQLRYA